MNFELQSLEEVIKCLFEVEEWQEWEVVKLNISNAVGLSMSVNTRINHPAGQIDYQQLKKLRELITVFISSNFDSPMVLDIKVRAPKSVKLKVDPKDEYLDLFVDFFSTSRISMVGITQVEKNLKVSNEPVTKWRQYVEHKMDSWYRAKMQ